MRRNNDELLANWGNLVNRTLVSAHRNFGAVPEPGELTEADSRVLAGVAAAFDEVGAQIEQARFRAAIAEAMRASTLANQYVAEQAPWALVKTDRERAATVLYVALRCVDSLKTLLAPFLPFTSQVVHELLGYDGFLAGPLEFRTVTEADGSTHEVLTGDYESWVGSWAPSELPAGQQLLEPRPLFRKLPPSRGGGARAARLAAAAMIDTHAHLDALDDEPAAVVARAREAGVSRILTVGTDVAGSRRALELADAHDGVYAVLGIHPHEATTRPTATSRRSARCSRIRRRSASGRSGLDWFRDYAPRDKQLRPVRREARRRRGHGQAGSDPHARRRRRHARRARRLRRHRRPALLLLAASAARGARARLVRLVRRQRHVPEGASTCARRARRCRPTASSPRPTRRTSRRRPCAASATSRRTSMHTLAGLARRATRTRPSSSGRSSATRPSASGCP